MNAPVRPTGVSRKATNIFLSAELAQVPRTRWQTENADNINAWNDFIEKDGMCLSQYRQF